MPLTRKLWFVRLPSTGSAVPLIGRLVACLLLLLPLQLSAAEASHGLHGMVLFGGREGLYAMHLPMFHAPHDRQIVLRVRFKNPQLDQDMRARLDGKTALWTLEPERFALHRLAPEAAVPLREFKANVVQGHFERGGSPRERQVDVAVERVVLYRALAPQPAVRAVSHYVPVGDFLVKLIDSRPDFDHIVLLKRAAAAPVDVAKLGVEDNEQALADRVPLVGTVYYDTADLR